MGWCESRRVCVLAASFLVQKRCRGFLGRAGEGSSCGLEQTAVPLVVLRAGPGREGAKGTRHLFSQGRSKEGLEESWDLPVPWSPSGSVWQRLCKICWEGSRKQERDRSEHRPLHGHPCRHRGMRPRSRARRRCRICCFP